MNSQSSTIVAWASIFTDRVKTAGSESPVSLILLPLFLGGAINWITDRIPWPPFDFQAAFNSALNWFLNVLVTGFLDAIGLFFITGLEYFLFYDNPRDIPALNEYWTYTLPLYVFIVFAMMFGYYVVMMLLSDTEDAEIQRIVERLILSAIFLAISREVYGFFVALTNEVAMGIYPNGFSFYVGVEMTNALSTSAAVTMTALFIAIAGGLGILVSGIIFYIVLAMRMLVIYVVYAIMPVLLGLWVVDVGPGKYGKFFADFMFKIAAMMMIMGIIISGILAVGAGVGGFTGGEVEGVDLASDYDESGDGTTILSTDPNGPESQITGEGRGGELQSEGVGELVFRIFMFLGTIWLIIATTTSLGGMMISAGSGSAGGTGGFQGSRSTGGSGYGGGQPAGAAAGGGGGWAARQNGQTAGSAHAYEMEDGRVAVANPAGGGVVLDPNGQSRETFGPEENPLTSAEAPTNPFNTKPETPDMPPTMGEKASYLDGKYGKNIGSNMKKSMQQVYSQVPQKAKAVGNLAKRAGKGYASVFKQPDLGSSIGEARRIARESPIGQPEAPEEDPVSEPSQGPVTSSGRDPFWLGRNPEHGRHPSQKSPSAGSTDTVTGSSVSASSATGTSAEGVSGTEMSGLTPPKQLQTKGGDLPGKLMDDGEVMKVEGANGGHVFIKSVKHSNMAGANALQTEHIMNQVGVDAPMHHYDPGERTIRSEGKGEDPLIAVDIGTSSVDASDIDKESFVDAYAGMGLAGHNDCHDRNVVVDKNGKVTPIDFDSAGSDPSARRPAALDEATKTADRLGLDVTEEEVAGRMEEMAQDYTESGDSAVEEIKSQLPDSGDEINEEALPDSTPHTADEIIELEREKAIEQANRVEEGIEDVAEGDTDWQRSMRNDNQVPENQQASQSDLDDLFDDL